MVYDCPVRTAEPLSHSFTLYQNIEHINIYYSRPSSIKDINTEELMNHVDMMLLDNDVMKWVWVVDFTGFGIKDMLNFGMYIKLTELISSKHSTFLRKIVIINHNFFTNSLLKIMYPFVSKRMRDVVMIVNL
jgi:hypothetical protein